MFSCKDSIDVLLEYLDGEMSAEQRTRLEDHLHGCSPCVEFLKSYKATPAICKKALKKEMPREIADRLTSFLRENLKKA